MTTRSIKKLFIFVSDTKRHHPDATGKKSTDDQNQNLYEDMLFSKLLGRLRGLELSRINLLFVAAKWDEAPNVNLDPKIFFRRHFPQTRAELRKFKKAQIQYVRFTVGSVAMEPTKAGGGSRAQIEKRDPAPVGRVIQWIYTYATGRALRGYPRVRRTLWERVKTWAAT